MVVRALSAYTYLDAIHDGLADALRSDERVFLLGEDIGHFGGASA
jgi:pyruvate/2-oxoglutarate/acetoin dehydrogenase E1 component